MRKHEYRFVEEQQPEDDEIFAFRRHWERCYAKYGSFEDTTMPPMRYTFGSIPAYAMKDNGVQIFSVKVAQLKEEEVVRWPLQVYGLIAIRDSIDPRRNLLFHRSRDDCQIVAQEDPFLLLTGPSRAVVLIDPFTFEVQLKARGETESEDKVLNFGIFTSSHACCYLQDPPEILTRSVSCNQSKIEFTFALLPKSVEATIRVEVVKGSWPNHLRGQVVAHTASIDHVGIVLLDSRDGKMPISLTGLVKLSRRVVSVELEGELRVDAVASHFDDNKKSDVVAKCQLVFTPKETGISYDICDLGFSKLGVTIAWSLHAPQLPGRGNMGVS